MRLVVLDTNVLVSGLLNPFGAPGRIIDAVLAGGVRLAFDDRILAEYAEVLARPRLRIDAEHARAVLDFVESEGLAVVASPLALSLPDPADAMFVEVAIAAGVDAIVTGNASDFPKHVSHRIPVLSPAEFLAALADTPDP